MLILTFLWASISVANATIPVYTKNDLIDIKKCLRCSYVLYDNINISDTWTPIGTAELPFTGSFNGSGYTIRFIGLSTIRDNKIGLFNTMLHASVSHLKLESNQSITVPDGISEFYFGLLAGVAKYCIIVRCTATLSSSISKSDGELLIGAIVGRVSKSLVSAIAINMSISVSNSKGLSLGGIAGEAISTAVTQCNVRTSISLQYIKNSCIGGLVGVSKAMYRNESILYTDPLKNSEYSLKGANNNTDSYIYCFARVNIFLIEIPKLHIGGFIGFASKILTLKNCSAAIAVIGSIANKYSASSIGGAVGFVDSDTFNMAHLYVTATFTMQTQRFYPANMYTGGLVGQLVSTDCTINHSSALINFSGQWNDFIAGGLIGKATSKNMTLVNNGAVGIISVTVSCKALANIGGIIGVGYNILAQQCYFIGNITVSDDNCSESNSMFHVGGIIAKSMYGFLESSFVLANITAIGENITAGGIALLEHTIIAGSYTAVELTTYTTTSLTIGGMAGHMTRESKIIDSCFLGVLNATGKANVAVIGGFIGLLQGEPNMLSASGSYAWGLVTMNLSASPNTIAGGFVGVIENTTSIDSCICYLVLHSTVSTTAGLFIGTFQKKQLPGSPVHPIHVLYSLAYVTPRGQLRDLELRGTRFELNLISSYCAGYRKTVYCVPLESLNTVSFLSDYDFKSTFQFNSSLVRGSLAFQTLPMPLSVSVVEEPIIALPTSSRAVYWLPHTWMIKPGVLQGYPYLSTIEYDKYCGDYRGCHGFGTSPLNAVCNFGWFSPPSNTTSLVADLARCNLFKCPSNKACRNNGTCLKGVCKCREGYVGLDCSEELPSEI